MVRGVNQQTRSIQESEASSREQLETFPKALVKEARGTLEIGGIELSDYRYQSPEIRFLFPFDYGIMQKLLSLFSCVFLCGRFIYMGDRRD